MGGYGRVLVSTQLYLIFGNCGFVGRYINYIDLYFISI